MKKLKIYLAGFECFLENSEELARNSVKLCEEFGFFAISPAIGKPEKSIDFSKGKQNAAKEIFNNNIEYIDECDVIIANLNNFRGWEPDAGTSFEMGYGFSKGKMLYAFLSDSRPCYMKYIGNIHKDGDLWRDDNGAFFENGTLNLMLSAPSTVVEGTLFDALTTLKNDIELQGEI